MSDYYPKFPVTVATLIGERVASVSGLYVGSEEVCFSTVSGRTFRMWHPQTCCESVRVADINIVGAPPDEWKSAIVLATDEGKQKDSGEKPTEGAESWTWTFYRIGCAEGTMVLRWLGQSNGYYGEDVAFEELLR